MSTLDRRKSLAVSMVNLSDMELKNIMSIVKNSWTGAKLGILTAGDDTQGMNPAIRAVVRTGTYLGCQVFYIKHGYKGMVDGADSFEEATWYSTSDIVGTGGTILKSYKCPEFHERQGRLKAAKNLVANGLQNLVVIGGDGTMKGINVLYNEWSSLLRELEEKSLVDTNLIDKCRKLNVVCIPASIINDVCNSDYSIGTNSALHRIMEAIDAISTTSSSSQLAFIVQLMGQTSGYLALVTGLICDASMIFIPEYPPVGNWRDEMCEKVRDDIFMGSEGILVVTCEGAVDRKGKAITPDEIKDTLHTRLNLNAKITVLGHVQRGGSPSAFDRTIASRMGVEAVNCLKNIPVEEGPSIVCFIHGNVTCLNLAEVLANNLALENSLHCKRYTDVLRLRGKNFQNLLNAYNLMNGLRSNVMPCMDIPGSLKIGIVRIGSSTISQCMVIRAVAGYCHSKNISVLAFKNGFTGVVNHEFTLLCWDTVKRWTNRKNVCKDTAIAAASIAGLDKIATALEKLNLSGLILVGNFMAYQSLAEINATKNKYKGLCIPMCMVPVALANNIPGSDVSIGADSALNEIISYCDKMRRAARGQTNRVFVIETMGKDCGFLATMSGLCVGADAAYIKQDRFNLDTILADAEHLRKKILHSGVRMGLIICGEKVNNNYNTDFIYRVFSEEGKGVYTCRSSTIGHVQVGGLPSVMDRTKATTAGLRAGEWLFKKMENCIGETGRVYTVHASSKSVLCFNRNTIIFTPVNQLVYETDFVEQLPTYLPWLKIRPMMRILAKHEAQVVLDFMSESSEASESDLIVPELKPSAD